MKLILDSHTTGGIHHSAHKPFQEKRAAADAPNDKRYGMALISICHNPRQNHLLAALSEETFKHLSSDLELVCMPLGKVLHEPGERLEHVYFPTTAIVSLLCILENGSTAEISMVGNDGLLGVSLFMSGTTTPNRAIVQSAGFGYRLKAERLQQEFNRSEMLRQLLLRYTQALITQTSQTAVCNRHHSVEQQVCRRLLLSLDRLRSNEIAMTHEQLSNILGVRREGVTETAGKLQRSGLIRYNRGHIEVLDRDGLEKTTCECYAVVKKEFDRLLSESPKKHSFKVPVLNGS